MPSVKEQGFPCVRVFSSSYKLTVIVQEIRGLMSHLYIISATEIICLTRCALCIEEQSLPLFSQTRCLHFHGTPSFRLLIQAEVQRLQPADCCRPAQHLANSWPCGGCSRHALIAVLHWMALRSLFISHHVHFTFAS